MKKNNRIKVIIANTAFIIRKGLRTLLMENDEFEFVAEISDTGSLGTMLNSVVADVLIVEHCGDDCFSTETIEEVKNNFPDLNILVISHGKSADEIKKIIGIGIKNYLLKDCDEDEIIDAIKSCAKGQKYFCGQIIDLLLEKDLSTEHCMTGSISERETQIIKMIVSGKRPKEIANTLSLSYHTIVAHKRNIFSKLGISSVIELAQYASKTGLIK